MVDVMSDNDLLTLLDDQLDMDGITDEEKQQFKNRLEDELEKPVKIIVAGQAGVGKSTLLRSIFAIEDNEDEIPQWLTQGPVWAETEEFRSFEIETPEGFKIEFTDGPGLGESKSRDKEIIPKWIENIKEHDLLCWVLDASSRDIAHIQENIEVITDKANCKDDIIVVLNKVDQIELRREDREMGKKGWDEEYNLPTDELEELINERTDHIKENLSGYTGISEEQMVACSALKRWNNDIVLDKMVDCLTDPGQRAKILMNRDINRFTELMSEEARQKLEAQGGD